MSYVKTKNNAVVEYPYSINQLRNDYPNTSFTKEIPAKVLAEYGVFKVSQSEAPIFDRLSHKISRENHPSLVDGTWVLGWVVEEKTAEEKKQHSNQTASTVRRERDRMLADTDWVVIMHTEKGTNIPLEWEVYRQALRDITDHANFPYVNKNDWPTKP